MPIYARFGVSHVWLLDPRARTLEVFRLDQQRWILVGILGGDGPARIEPFDAIELNPGRWGRPKERQDRINAEGGTRTPTPFRAHDSKPCASAIPPLPHGRESLSPNCRRAQPTAGRMLSLAFVH
jgi:Putative restriction endonuclease